MKNSYEREMEATYAHTKAIELHGWAGQLALVEFLALADEGRAQVWASADEADKRGLVLQAIRHHGGDLTTVTEAEIARWLDKYDAKYAEVLAEAAKPQPAAEVVEALAELEQLARSAAQAARTDEARGLLREANAYHTAALAYTVEGIRPQERPDGSYELPSRRQDTPHRVRYVAGRWVCSCAAGRSAHWAQALVIAVAYAEALAGSVERRRAA